MKALIIMDMQEVTVGKNHAQMFSYEDELLQNINRRIEEVKDAEDTEVYYIKNLMKKNLINRLAPVQVYQGSPEAELAEGLFVISNNIFEKYKPDAFSNDAFAEQLKRHNITQVEIIGVDGGGCVAYTALGAARNGYSVLLNEKCIGTVMTKQALKMRKKLDAAGVLWKEMM